jgi:predicted phage terminase large subunit-like protein
VTDSNPLTPTAAAPLLGIRARKRLEFKLKTLEAQHAQLEQERKALARSIKVEETRQRALEDFYFFTKEILGFKELYAPLHKPLCDLISNEKIKRRMVLIPRGHFKTTIISIAYPLWLLCRDQNCRIALLSKSAGKSEENLAEVVMRAESPRFQFLFGKTIGHPRDWKICRKDTVLINRKGSTTGPSIAAYGTESSEVGRHCDHMLIDDMVDHENLNSVDSRDKIWSWFGRQLSVLDPNSVLTVIGTRWHWDDPYSRIQKKLVTYAKNKDVGWWIVRRKAIEDGKCIFPTRFNKKELDEIKKVQGDYIYSCFYNNEPTGEGINPFDIRKIRWINYDQKKQPYWTYILVDPASTKESYSSYTGIIVGDALGTKDQRFVVRRAILKKLHPDEVVDTVFDLVEEYKPRNVIIEDEGYQKSLSYWMKRDMMMRGKIFHIKMVKNPRNLAQDMRLMALQPFVNGGAIMFDRAMSGKEHMVEEFETYPKGPHKDLLCALYFITRVFFPAPVAPAREK